MNTVVVGTLEERGFPKPHFWNVLAIVIALGSAAFTGYLAWSAYHQTGSFNASSDAAIWGLLNQYQIQFDTAFHRAP